MEETSKPTTQRQPAHTESRAQSSWADEDDEDRPTSSSGRGFGDRQPSRGGYENRGFSRGGGGGGRGGSGGGGFSRDFNSRGGDRYTAPYNSKLSKLEEEELFGQPNTGVNFDAYEDIPVKTAGKDVPEPIESFDDVELPKILMSNISLARYTKPTPIQKYSMPIILAQRDLMACAQTGSGKTAAFLFPMIARILQDGPNEMIVDGNSFSARRKAVPASLVLAPTRELATQIFNEARKFTYKSGLRIVVVYGGSDIRQQLRELDRGCDILVATPGRLVDLMERGKVTLRGIRYLCLDEADRMLDMGFEPQIRRIVEQEDMPQTGDRQTLMFSATFPKPIQHLAADFLDQYVMVTVGRIGSTTESITQRIEYIEEPEKRDFLVGLLNHIQGLTLVFVETKRGADSLEDFLYREGFKVASIHGDRSQPEREAALRSFKNGNATILVATDVASRGLDIPSVAHVVNYDLPTDIDDYVHRIGRTGRAGHTGIATAFFNDKNRNIVAALHTLLSESEQDVPPWMQDMVQDMQSDRGHFSKRGGRGRGRGGYRGGGGGGFRGGYNSNYNNRDSYSGGGSSVW